MVNISNSLHRQLFNASLVAVVSFLVIAPSIEAWIGNKDYDGRNPLFGMVASDENETEEFYHHHASMDDVNSVPDIFFIFAAMLQWFQ